MADSKTLYKLTKAMTVLLVEDNPSLRNEMSEILEDLVKSVTSAEDGKEALSFYKDAQSKGKSYDLIISDIQMPNMNGVEFAKKVREIDENQTIVILSAYTDKEYLLELINIGILKFITKPVAYDELLAVLYKEGKNIDKIADKVTSTAEINLSESYTWNRDTYILTHENKPIALTRHELLLLEFFISKEGYICSNDDIVEQFYEHRIEISERNVRNLVFKLRKKIPEECIENVYGLGYKFHTKNVTIDPSAH